MSRLRAYILFMVAVGPLTTMRTGLAEGAHGHAAAKHAGAHGDVHGKDSGARETNARRPNKPGADARDTSVKHGVDSDNAVPLSRPAAVAPQKATDLNAKSRSNERVNFPPPIPAVVPAPVVRDAIGRHLAQGAKTSGRHVDTPGAAAAMPPRYGEGVANAAVANVGHHSPPAIVSAPSRGKIDGAGLLNPSVALSGVGGPAKPVGGINGTTLRLKR